LWMKTFPIGPLLVAGAQLCRCDPLVSLRNATVADPENAEPGTRAIRRFNEMVKQDDRVSSSLVTIGDGLTLILKEFE